MVKESSLVFFYSEVELKINPNNNKQYMQIYASYARPNPKAHKIRCYTYNNAYFNQLRSIPCDCAMQLDGTGRLVTSMENGMTKICLDVCLEKIKLIKVGETAKITILQESITIMQSYNNAGDPPPMYEDDIKGP